MATSAYMMDAVRTGRGGWTEGKVRRARLKIGGTASGQKEEEEQKKERTESGEEDTNAGRMTGTATRERCAVD